MFLQGRDPARNFLPYGTLKLEANYLGRPDLY
jgi:hypothetical protein